MLNQQHDTRIPEFLPLAKVERVVGVAGRHREAPRVAMVVEKREISSTLRHHDRVSQLAGSAVFHLRRWTW
jgi:hypothetical protein